MIVPMKKISVIVQSRDAQAALESLGGLGVLHVEHQQLPQGQDINALKDEISLLKEAIGILSNVECSNGQQKKDKIDTSDWKNCARHILDCYKRLNQLQDYSRNILQQISQWQDWGDFDPNELVSLTGNNIYVRLYEVPIREIKKFTADVNVKVISKKKGIAKCAVFSYGKPEIAFKEVGFPKMSISKMRQRIAEDTRAIAHIKDQIQKHACLITEFSQIKDSFEKKLEFQETLCGMGQIESLMYLKGYIPHDAASALADTAKQQKWGIVIEDPTADDTVPTLIRNPRWISIIKPVFKLLGIIPGYSELDISPLFLIFLSLFFGMIIGDAGYGLVYFLLTFWFQKKFAPRLKDRRIFSLFYLFSACAIFWGLLTGTVFGQEWYVKVGFKPLIPILNDTKFLQAFCFFIGAFHLTLGHGWQAIRKIPSLTALADFGWICVLWAAFFLARTLILNDPFPFFGKWLIIGGLTLVIFCTSLQKNILKTIGNGLAAVALSLMNNFTDVVSYIRLFAVGLAGVAIADTVNSLALSVGSSSYLTRFIIIFLGHTLNIILGPMSVLVHGIRLNVLEFSGHAGLSWGGVAYKPLK